MSVRECLGDLLDLSARFGRSKVDRRADAGGTQVERLVDVRVQRLVVRERIGERLVVVDLEDERDPGRVSARHRTRAPSVDATALQPPSIASLTMFSGSK